MTSNIESNERDLNLIINENSNESEMSDLETERHVKPISPIVIIKGQNVRSYKRPKGKDSKINGCVVWHKSQWFWEDCNRNNANLLLESAQNGTFIVRKSSLFR